MTIADDPLANWNGEEMPLSAVRVPALDRGFLFGDAVYEVCRVYRGRPFLFADHIDRLRRNFVKMRLNADADGIAARALETLAHSRQLEATIYIQVTRGAAPRTHHFPDASVLPNELIYIKPYRDRYGDLRQNGAKVIITPDLRWKRCDIKSVNLLANCLAAEEAHAQGCLEALLVDEHGVLVEGSHTSLFGVRDGAILTAPLGPHLLPGITRRLVLRLAGEIGVACREEALTVESLQHVDELFLTGTSAEVMPVVQAGDHSIGPGRPGPVVNALQQAYANAIDFECGQSAG